MATPLPMRAPVVVGLSRAQELMTAGDFFDAFAWEPDHLDAEAMTAQEFLDSF